jgi:uncharacterized protein (DUF302 family)
MSQDAALGTSTPSPRLLLLPSHGCHAMARSSQCVSHIKRTDASVRPRAHETDARGELPQRIHRSKEIAMNLEASYGITRRVPKADFEVVKQRLIAALAAEGFGILTEIDMHATLKKKIDADIGQPYVVLGACNPKLAHRALGTDASVGLLLPCNVVITREDSDVIVSAVSPKALFGLPGVREDLRPIAEEAEERLRRSIEKFW